MPHVPLEVVVVAGDKRIASMRMLDDTFTMLDVISTQETSVINFDISTASVFVGERQQHLVAQMTSVTLDFTVRTVLSLNPNVMRILYRMTSSALAPAALPVVNALDRLMQSSTTYSILPARMTERDGPSRLFNWLIDLLQSTPTARWSSTQSDTMEKFMKRATKALWMIDGQHQKFLDANRVDPLPAALHWNPPFRAVLDASGHLKRNAPALERTSITQVAVNLSNLDREKWFNAERWSLIRAIFEGLQRSLATYAAFLEDKAVQTKSNHARLHHLPHNRSIETCVARATRMEVSDLYRLDVTAMIDAVELLDEYCPLSILLFAPTEKTRRFRFMQYVSTSMPFSCQIYRITKPSSMAFIWRIPSTGADATSSADVVAQLDADIPIKHTRAMRQRVINVFNAVSIWTRPKIVMFVSALSGDMASEQGRCRDQISIMQEMLDSGHSLEEALEVEESVRDDHSGKFDVFWAMAQSMLDLCAVPDERRHGTSLYMGPDFVSLRDLREKVMAAMPTGQDGTPVDPVPSEEHFRLQFTPRNPGARVSSVYTSRFNIKMCLQTRLIRKYHPDHHYGSKQWVNAREFAARYHKHAVVFLVDEKASIPLGPAGVPVSATRRMTSALLPAGAADHDHIPQHLTPSISIKLRPSENPRAGWYHGKPDINLKCSIFQPSSAMRHAVELAPFMADDDPAIIILGADGGPDHNVKHVRVQLSLIALFLQRDLDHLIALRTPPHLSVINPAERFMSVCNQGLVGTALCCDELPADDMIKVKGLLSKKAWREAQISDPATDYRKLASDGTTSARRLLTRRFTSLVYKGESVTVSTPAADDTILMFRDVLADLLTGIDLDAAGLTKAVVERHANYKAFAKDHVRANSYVFQVKKCLLDDCPFHLPVRTDKDVFADIKWLPTPIRDTSRDMQYLSFADSYTGEDPNDDACPSRSVDESSRDDLPKPNGFKCCKQTARAILFCSDCERPRLLFARTILSLDQNELLQLALESLQYTCGSPLFVEGHPLENEIMQHWTTCCALNIDRKYYEMGDKLAGYKWLCASCLNSDESELAIEAEEYKGLPRCTYCKVTGLEPMPLKKMPNNKRPRHG